MNLFTNLSKGNISKENYLTEALVYLLNHLLKNNKEFVSQVLSRICELNFEEGEQIDVSSQIDISIGILDMKIETDTKLIYVENKIDASLGVDQIRKYREHLERRKKEIKKVILVSKWETKYDDLNKPDKHLRWYEVHKILEQCQKKHQGEFSLVDQFLIDEFMSYMKEANMTIERVSWEFHNGVKSMLNLIEQIRLSLNNVGCIVTDRSAGQQYNGFYFKIDKESQVKDWIGIFYYDNKNEISLDSIVFEVASVKIPATSRLEYPIDKDRFNNPSFLFNFEKNRFFCLSKDEQLETLERFLDVTIKFLKQHNNT